MERVVVIGGGLSGCECALQLAARGIPVELWEQRPAFATEAHQTEGLAELVCSNSFKSTDPARAPGLLKEELRLLGCRLLEIADGCTLPGGAAMVIDRWRFSEAVTARIEAEPLIKLRRERFEALPQAVERGELIVLATGPLTSGGLWQQLSELLGDQGCYFYDATSPIITSASVDNSIVFAQSRYDKGEGDDYFNCPFTREQYSAFREALLAADVYPLTGGDDYKLFEGCLPIEELAERGEDTMRFGPLKPVGLRDPRSGQQPWAAVQLRHEDTLGNALSLVGFQTRLRFGEQERVFRMIPGLEQAEFMRFGRMHRNSYIDAPRLLEPTLQLKGHPRVVIAGQLTGLEGYVSAISTGLWAGLNSARLVRGEAPLVAPEGSCLGSMLRFMTNPKHKHYAPTGFQFGMLTWLPEKMRRREKAELIRRRAEESWQEMLQQKG